MSLREKPTTTMERNSEMTTHVNRIVVGPDAEGRSAVLQHGLTNVQSREGFYWRATLWATAETPVDNSIDGDRSRTDGLGASREPFPNGMICRALEIPPDDPDAAEHRRVLADLNDEVHQKHRPSQTDLARHPSMHRTDTLDCLTCVRGEIFLVTDTDEVLMRPGDTVIIRGTNHAWSNRSNAPCLLVGTMTDATPAKEG
jgi:mannose-6-phosphate isomerase-like protein (cupin superfamily)